MSYSWLILECFMPFRHLRQYSRHLGYSKGCKHLWEIMHTSLYISDYILYNSVNGGGHHDKRCRRSQFTLSVGQWTMDIGHHHQRNSTRFILRWVLPYNGGCNRRRNRGYNIGQHRGWNGGQQRTKGEQQRTIDKGSGVFIDWKRIFIHGIDHTYTEYWSHLQS